MRFAVLGRPVEHSLSPAMHRTAYAELGLAEHTYEAIDVGEEGLAELLDGLDRSWRGLSLTMPLKRRAVGLVDSLDEWARAAGAVNTVLLTGRRRLGFNTDVPGAMAALLERVHDPVDEVVVLGGGATATSVLLAAVELGCSRATLLVREPARAEETAAQVRAHRRSPRVEVARLDEARSGASGGPVRADLVVSTVPAAAQTPALLASLERVPALFDAVYDPWPTPLMRWAESAGRPCVTGIDLLAQQAVLQLDVMVGRTVSADLLRGAALRELKRRTSVERASRGPSVP